MPDISKGGNILGVLLVDKPPQWTSHDVVAALRKWLGIKAVGHSGTLDPTATGLLIILLGKATRLSEYLQGYDKTYTGTITLGVATDTYDAEGKVTEQQPCQVTAKQVEEAAATFVPGYLQTPPLYAAVKVKGQAAYRLARQGKQVKLKPRAVKIYKFTTKLATPNKINFQVNCSSGTYIRSLAVDLVAKLNCVGHLSSLRRKSIGPFKIEQAISLAKLKQAIKENRWQSYLLPALKALPWPLLTVKEASVKKVKHGQPLSETDFLFFEAELKVDQLVKLATKDNLFLAVGFVTHEKPLVVKVKKLLLSE